MLPTGVALPWRRQRVSESTVGRIWRQNGLKPHRIIGFKVSYDPLFLHIICDNYATHKHPVVKAWLEDHPRVHVHFTPTSSSWLNMGERFFR